MRTDKTTAAGLGIVGLAAAVLTFTTLFQLAVMCGYSPWLAWLLPVAVDMTGMVAARIWWRQGEARGLTITCIVLSVAGNAVQHGLAAYDLLPPWWVIVLVSAVPPAMLGAVVHLAHRVTVEPQPDLTPPVLTPVDPISETVRTPADELTPRELTPPARDPADLVASLTPPGKSDDELVDRLTTWTAEEGAVPSRERIRVEFGIGTKRAARLREMVSV